MLKARGLLRKNMEKLANRGHKTDLTDNAYNLLYSLRTKAWSTESNAKKTV